MRVFIPETGHLSDWQPVVKMFEEAGWELTHHFDEAELICFTGGADVSPHLYGEENIFSDCNPERDKQEQELYEFALELTIPMVGICRGGQFLNVMNGGKMIQHIDGHSGDRKIDMYDSLNTQIVREDHHQGMVPPSNTNNYIVLAKDHGDENYEILLYKKTECLCFQPHPEWGHEGTRKLFFDLLTEYLL